jgi:hypothetical protein
MVLDDDEGLEIEEEGELIEEKLNEVINPRADAFEQKDYEEI